MPDPSGKRTRPAGRRGAARSGVVIVSADQRQCLIEDVAYFRAKQYRVIEPGNYRRQDLAAAAAEIEIVLRRYTRRGGG